MYVEDNEDNIYMLSRRLKRKNFDPSLQGWTSWRSSSKGKSRYNSDDLSLPVLDGWGATRKLKSDASTKDIPIIALSAHAMEEHKSSAIEAGCNDYDTKPVDFARLMSKIA